MALYLIYPILLPVLQTYSSDMLQVLIILMYQIQFLPYLLIKHIAPLMNTILYIHPVFKLPVFIGVHVIPFLGLDLAFSWMIHLQHNYLQHNCTCSVRL